ncbi:MAG: flavodoxin [Prevotellaceae bacterium]|nr:flavodoxin [Prevotellaceae bacterium]MDO4932463.1 flavodoxin [Prevotellaceae bacterium]
MMRKKGIIAAAVLVVSACIVIVYCWASGGDDAPEEAGAMRAVSEQRVRTVAGGAEGKSLIVYFSVPETDGVDASSGASRVISNGKVVGNTEYVASVIGKATGGDLFEIKTVHAYPASHQALIDAAKTEIDDNVRPELATHIENLKDYDVVFVGFPNWWYDMPMSLYSFFDEYDFCGKTIVPFCTHGGSRFSDAVKTIREMEQQATVLDGYAIARDRVPDSEEDILNWLKRIGM